jgi:hypothetical protein
MFTASSFAAETNCLDVQFSDELYERFPNINEACLQIIDQEGEQYVKLKGKVLRANSRILSLRWQRRDGSYISEIYRSKPLPSEFRIQIDGNPVRPRQLERGQELNVYVKLGGDMASIIAAPEVELIPALVDLVAEVIDFDPAPTTLPTTAGLLPAIGLLGLMSLGFGLLIRLFRRRDV